MPSSAIRRVVAAAAQVFTNRSFLTKLLAANRDINRLAEIDAELTAILNDMQTALQVSVGQLQVDMYAEMKAANAQILKAIGDMSNAQVRRSAA